MGDLYVFIMIENYSHVFKNNKRNQPLYLGSWMSNVGGDKFNCKIKYDPVKQIV